LKAIKIILLTARFFFVPKYFILAVSKIFKGKNSCGKKNGVLKYQENIFLRSEIISAGDAAADAASVKRKLQEYTRRLGRAEI